MGKAGNNETSLVPLLGLDLDGRTADDIVGQVLVIDTENDLTTLGSDEASGDSLVLVQVVDMSAIDIDIVAITGVELALIHSHVSISVFLSGMFYSHGIMSYLPEIELVDKVSAVVSFDEVELGGRDRTSASQNGRAKSSKRRGHDDI